jgi:diguanylate cyclase (GGDEF)-like protein
MVHRDDTSRVRSEQHPFRPLVVRVDRRLRHLPPWALYLICLLLILLLGWADYHTGVEASFSVFYLAPICLVAWYDRSRVCYLFAILGACVWDYSNVLAGEVLSQPFFYIWNGVVRLIFFSITSNLLQSLRRMLEAEQELARKDFLTGLLNSRAFRDCLERERARALCKQKPLTLAFLDLDHFKQVNDELGHAEGDRVLTLVAQTLKAELRSGDTIARMGGDEFALLLPDCGPAQAPLVGEKLLKALRQMSATQGWPVGASVGMVVCDLPDLPSELLLKQADQLMYRVKEKGRNQALVASCREGVPLSVADGPVSMEKR